VWFITSSASVTYCAAPARQQSQHARRAGRRTISGDWERWPLRRLAVQNFENLLAGEAGHSSRTTAWAFSLSGYRRKSRRPGTPAGLAPTNAKRFVAAEELIRFLSGPASSANRYRLAAGNSHHGSRNVTSGPEATLPTSAPPGPCRHDLRNSTLSPASDAPAIHEQVLPFGLNVFDQRVQPSP